MKVLVVGCNGMLGQDLMLRLGQSEHGVVGLDIPDIDITNGAELLSKLEGLTPGLVINCAAYTAVDRAESEVELAFSVNRDGSANLARACNRQGAILVHISTDYVFDGNTQAPYKENDPGNPLGVYGQSKWEGEEAVRRELAEHLIVRTAWLFGARGPNFVKTILRLSREREEVRVVADQFGCPTWTGNLADALLNMVEQIAHNRAPIQWGTYHYCGSGKTTWHGFAEAIVAEGRQREPLQVKRIIPITTAEYPTPAARPAWSVLDCGKIERNFGIAANKWQDGLSAMVGELYSASEQ